MIEYGPANDYRRALTVGLLNTLRVAVVGIIFATFLGTLIGIARLSKNWLIRKIASVYVEVMRNIPLLLQLFFWYAIISETMPGPRQALKPLPGVFISNRGIKLPWLQGDGLSWLLWGVLLAIVLLSVCRAGHVSARKNGSDFPRMARLDSHAFPGACHRLVIQWYITVH